MRTPPKTSFWKYLEDYPPIKVRLFAKHPGGGRMQLALSHAEIAIKSDMTLDRVREISFSLNWNDINVREIRAFLSACNFDPTVSIYRNRVTEYNRVCLKRKTKPFQYLKRHPKWESEFLPLVKALQLMESQKTPSSVAVPINSPVLTSAA